MDFEDFLPLFISESKDNLTTFEDNLVKLTPDADEELVNTLFRAIHSIKGGAGMFKAPRLIEVAHTTETTLDKIRNGQLTPNNDLIDIFFQSKDIIEIHLSNLENGNDEPVAGESELLVALSQFSDNPKVAPSNKPSSPSTQPLSNRLIINIDQDAFMMGFRLEPLLQDVKNNHEISSLDIDYIGPEFDNLNPVECHTTVSMVLSPPMNEEQLEELLSFSAGAEGRLEAIGANTAQDDSTQPIIDIKDDIIEQHIASEADKHQANQSKDANQASATNLKPTKQVRSKGELIKVNSLKLDRLVDDVGELVSLKSQLKAVLQDSKDKRLNQLIKEFDKSLNDLRDTSLALRLVPLHETLARFHRVVREAAKVTEKSIHLEVIGGQTELDRVTVEKLIDPLTHIVRNSCDHGIEDSAQRQSLGKPAMGNITIHAQYKGSGVSLKVIDDGKGLDKDRILAKAKSSGIVAEHDQLTDREIYQLIFHPGLSTAEKVTDLSGRGVGMDVVRRNINQLGGDILIDSTPNQGTVLDIRLPLTTAILDGFMIKVGDADLVVQMDSIIECMRREELAERMVGKQSCIELRGDYIPVISLARHLALTYKQEKPEGLMVNTQFGKVVLAVDYLLGELQTVVKPLDVILQQSQLFSGIVKVAEGDIGFVLDINKLVIKADQEKHMRQLT